MGRLGTAAAWLGVAGGIVAPGGCHARHPQGFEDAVQRSDAAELAGQYIDGFMRRERLEAENAFLPDELGRLRAAGEAGSPGMAMLEELKWINPATRQALVRVLQESARPLVQDLELTSTQLSEQVEQHRSAWHSIRSALDRDRMLLFEIRASRQMAGQLASLLSVDNRWFWLGGLVAVGALAAVVFHDRRHEIRRVLNGGRARAMRLSKFLTLALSVLVGITLATFAMGDRIYQSLLVMGAGAKSSPRSAIVAENAALEEEIGRLREVRRQLDQRRAVAVSAWRNTLSRSLPPGSILASQWEEAREQILEITAASALLESLPGAMQSDLEELQRVRAELEADAEASARLFRLKRWIRGLLGCALLGLAATGGLLFWRGVVQRSAKTANTCPLCLGVGRLEHVGPEDRRGDGEPSVQDCTLVRCRNVITQQPYEECDYAFMEAYRGMDKVCFPTLGVPQAGKTHWLAMLYWELGRGNYPETVQFEKLRSQSSGDFDLIVQEILESRIGTAATQRERIPHPLVFNFRDHDRLGRSNILVNIFDYSGEVTSDMGVEDYRRRRALEGDGFFFFLDPTFPSEPQAKALAEFREDLRLIKGIKAGKRTRTPVALCVSKIDLLAGQSYALPDGRDAVGDFYRELKEIDPSGEGLRPEVIEARSRAMARLRETIWPGWQIERQVDHLFGGRYMFFPLTPVGLDGRGETDLSLRTISPFGLLEPLVWLLQMSGYSILE